MIHIDPKKYRSDNFLPVDRMIEVVKELKKNGKKVGLSTGTFDLLHPGHVTHFISTKKLCDVLVVAVANDNYAINKNPCSGRPIYSEELRAFMVSKLKPVDYVFLDDGSVNTVDIIRPDIWFKGSDYIKNKNEGILIQEQKMAAMGGKVHYTEDEKLSTTDILKHIKEKIII
jgi:rfaE bifunctional protein nucleotidyltransferase chain/domain